MNKPLLKSAIGMAACLVALTSNAAVISLDPVNGSTGSFEWSSGLGPADDSFSIVVSTASTIDVTLTDCCIPGDVFALRLDGNLVAWTTAGVVGQYFTGFADDVALSAGSHLFTVELTALAPGFTTGGASYAFSPTAAVPEPGSYALMLAGLAAVGLSRLGQRR